MYSEEYLALKCPKLSSNKEDDFDTTGKIKILGIRYLFHNLSDFLKSMFVLVNVDFDSASSAFLY
jgi:hypothetical protein